jgi:hypothetical protein
VRWIGLPSEFQFGDGSGQRDEGDLAAAAGSSESFEVAPGVVELAAGDAGDFGRDIWVGLDWVGLDER